MAEREQQTAHHLLNTGMGRAAVEVRRGQYLGLAAASLALGATSFLGYFGHGAAAGVVGATTVVGLAAAFVVGRRDGPAGPKRSEAAEVREPEPGPQG